MAVRMTAPNGANVTVADRKVDILERQGFTVVVVEKKAPAKRAPRTRSAK